MDFQNRAGSKPGSGGVAGFSEANVDRRERLRKLALETIDLNKDPYFMKNHLGSYECKLCLTLHSNEGSYLAHTQGKKHQTNLARRAAKEQADRDTGPRLIEFQKPLAPVVKKNTVKIGRPGYKVTKIRDHASRSMGLLFQIMYPEIGEGVIPRHRFMSAYEQKVEAPNRAWQYLIFTAEPYENVAFKVQSLEVEGGDKFWTHWDPDSKTFTLQFLFRAEPARPSITGMPPPRSMMPLQSNPLNPFANAPPPPQAMYGR